MKNTSVRKGAWSEEEDSLLRKCIEKYGEGKWHQVPLRAGLNRCRKGCRLRWLNYLRPNIKRGGFKEDEIDLIVKMHKLLGNRWSLISGRLPGRTANDIKNYWNSHLRKKLESLQVQPKLFVIPKPVKDQVFRPKPTTFSSNTVSHDVFIPEYQGTQQQQQRQRKSKEQKKQKQKQGEEQSDVLIDSEEQIKWLNDLLLNIDDSNEQSTNFTAGNTTEGMDQENLLFDNDIQWNDLLISNSWLIMEE